MDVAGRAVIEDQKQPAVRALTIGSAGEYLVKLKVRMREGQRDRAGGAGEAG